MDALAGRMPPPRPPGRVALLGLVFVIGGGAILAAATVGRKAEMIAAGIVGMLVGVLLAIPLLVSSLGRVTNLLPTTGRLAARDAARHGRKTGAAVAAGVIALATPVAVAAYSLSEETYERRSPRLLANQLMIGGLGEVAGEPSGPELEGAFADVFPDASVVPLAQAVSSREGDIQDGAIFVDAVAPGELGGESTGGATTVAWPLFVGDGKMLASIGADEGAEALEEGRAVVLGGYAARKGFVRVSTGGPGPRRAKVAAVTVDSTGFFNESIPRVVVSPETAARLGLRTRVANRLLTNPTTLSSDEIASARDVAEQFPGVFVRSNDDYLPRYAAARAVATAASLPLGLAILAVAVALVASESRRSHQILAAIGAGPLAHRKIVAATAALLGGMAALLAVPAGFLPAAVVQSASQTGRPVVFPWTTAAIVVLVVPALAALVAALVSRTPRLGSLLSPTT
jgi:putative ABC transport system permease protein